MLKKHRGSYEKGKIKFVILECGHTVTPDIGMGICSKCLQIIDGKLSVQVALKILLGF